MRAAGGGPPPLLAALFVGLLVGSSGAACRSGSAAGSGSGGVTGQAGTAGSGGMASGGAGPSTGGSGGAGGAERASDGGGRIGSGGAGGKAGGVAGNAPGGQGGALAGGGNGGARSLASLYRLCGNGRIDAGEDCDDGNTFQGDGCTSICQLSTGWICPDPGQPCDPPRCGDGVLDDNEACDDSNTQAGDGCAPDCQSVDSGWTCGARGGPCSRLEAPAPCDAGKAALCGDGCLDELTEACDDGAQNVAPYTPTMQPGCGWGCRARQYCGDGHVDAQHGEACDLGTANGRPLEFSGGGQAIVCDSGCQYAQL